MMRVLWITGAGSTPPNFRLIQQENPERHGFTMSNGNRNQRNRGGNQQRRRRPGGGNQRNQQAPRGPAMTALGESTYEAVFDHGNEGYGIWFDGMVREDPTYRQNWKGTGLRPIYVKIEEDRIVITKELDRPKGQDLAADDAESSNGSGDSQETFTEEEAAQLLAAGMAGSPVATPESEASSVEAAAEESAEADETEEADSEEDAKPAPRKRVTRRRTPKAEAATDDE